MDNANILATLAKLEESIKGIDSAKKQVDDVIKGYGDAKKAFDVLAKSMSGVKTNVDSVLKAVKEKADSLDAESKAISTEFKTGCDRSFTEAKKSQESVNEIFEKGVSSSVSRLNDTIEALGGCVSSLNKLTDVIISAMAKVDLLHEELKKAKSEVVSEVRSKSDETKSKLDGKINELSGLIETKASEIIELEGKQNTTLSNIMSSINSLKREQESSQILLNSILKKQKLVIKIIAIITLIVVIAGILLYYKVIA